MAFYFPEGSAFYFSTTLAAAKTVSAITNANPASATSTSHGYSDNDEVLFTSGWEDATNSVYRVNQTDANTFELLGLNSTNTTFYAAGAGVGTTEKLSSWTSIPQLLTIATQGGDPRFTTVQLLASRNAINVPTGFNAYSLTLTLAHDPAAANWLTMQNISRTLTKVAMKIALGGGGTIYGYGYMACSEMPSMNANQVNQVTAAVTFLGRPISYST
jgi:hypothetical protein